MVVTQSHQSVPSETTGNSEELRQNSFWYCHLPANHLDFRIDSSVHRAQVDPINWAELPPYFLMNRDLLSVFSALTQVAGKNDHTPLLFSLQQGGLFDPNVVRSNFSEYGFVILRGSLSAIQEGAYYDFGPGAICRNPAELQVESSWLTTKEKLSLILIPLEVIEEGEAQHPLVRKAFSTDTIEKAIKSRFSADTRSQIRQVRDANIHTIARLTAIDVVNARENGILTILNPRRCEFQDSAFTVYNEEGYQTLTGQAWRLIEGVAKALYYMNISDIRQLAVRAFANAESASEEVRVRQAFEFFERGLSEHDPSRAHQEELVAIARDLESSTDLDRGQWIEVAKRIQQIRWLALLLVKRQEAMGEGSVQAKDASDILSHYQRFAVSRGTLLHFSSERDSVLGLLDHTLEYLFSIGSAHSRATLWSIRFEKLHRERAGQLDEAPGAVLAPDHKDYQVLRDVEAAIARGEVSAVGGRIYGESRLPSAALEALRSGRAKAFVYSGPPEDEEPMVRMLYGTRVTGDGLDLLRGVKTNLNGLYGGFVRSLMAFVNDQVVITMVHPGDDRRLSNALSLVISGVPVEQIVLAGNKKSDKQRIHRDLAHLLEQSETQADGLELLGNRVVRSRDYPTHLVIAQRPQEFWQQFEKDRLVVQDFSAPNIGKVQIGLLRDTAGELVRIVIPTVGSRGLYGNTAGLFTESFFDLVRNASPHVIFNGTAGGFTYVDESLAIPTTSIGSEDGRIQIQTLNDTVSLDTSAASLAYSLLQARLRHAAVQKIDHHFSVRAPGQETDGFIERIKQSGYSTIDVEGFPIAQSLTAVEVSKGIKTTFNPIYVISDNPEAGIRDQTQTLAMNGPLLEGSRPLPELHACLASLLDLAHARTWGRRILV